MVERCRRSDRSTSHEWSRAAAESLDDPSLGAISLIQLDAPRRRGLRVQLFAGGGGASQGEREATGESPDVAVNHWPVAIALHRANHPETTHHIADVLEVDPLVAIGGLPVDFLWMSPRSWPSTTGSAARARSWVRPSTVPLGR